MKVSSFKQLDVWLKGIHIVKRVYEVTKDFPKEEIYGLTSQLRRAAVSVPSNIAEGYARANTGEYRQFCHMAKASCAELETQVIIAQELGYLTEEDRAALEEMLDHESRMLRNLIRSLDARN